MKKAQRKIPKVSKSVATWTPSETKVGQVASISQVQQRPKWWTILLLGLIITLGFGLRILMINIVPKGALIDEAHFGYLAYSLIHTGKDEHGIPWPIIFKGFGDQKLPGYAYVLLPVIKLWGLSNATIRIPSIVVGTLLIPVIFALIGKLGWSRRSQLLGALIVAISPWSFFLSRFGFESNLGLFCFSVGLLLLAKAVNVAATSSQIRSKLVWFAGAGFILALTWYCYIAYRPVVLVFTLLWLLVARWQQKVTWKQIALTFVTMVVTILPLFTSAAVGSNTTRFNQVGITHDQGIIQDVNELRAFCSFRLPKVICYPVFNKYLIMGEILSRRMIYTFAPQYMATIGEDGLFFLAPRNFGQIFFVTYLFLVIGATGVVRQIANKPTAYPWLWFLLLGLLIAPIPALLVGDPQKVRLTPLLPFVVLTTVLGIENVIVMIHHRVLAKLAMGSLVVAMTLAAGAFYIYFFSVHTVKYDYTYQSYLPELMSWVHERKPEEQVFFKPFFSDPLMFYAYYTKMDPAEYQQKAILGPLEDSGFQHTVGLGNLHVKDESLRNIGCAAVKGGYQAYLVTDVQQDKNTPVKIVRSENGALQYVFVYDANWYANKYPELCRPE
jgi:hypothetical protein